MTYELTDQPDASMDALTVGAIALTPRAEPFTVPAIIADLGDHATRRFLEFFTVNIRNPNTRAAYAHAVTQFLRWCEGRRLSFRDIEPMAVAAYIESHPGSDPTRKQHLAAIKMFFDWLVTGQLLAFNPAAAVRGPKHVVKKGKTPVLSATEARSLFNSIDISTVIGLRDRALIAVMVYSFARIGAVVGMKGDDYYQNGLRRWFRLHEKGGKFHEVPAHHNADAYLHEYIEAAGIAADRKGPLFRSAAGRTGLLTDRPLRRNNALDMVKRRVKAAGLSDRICCDTFQATGITAYLENGGTIEKARQIAAHESPKTTKLYERTIRSRSMMLILY
jgi:integrase/recombinase XerD